MLAVSGLAGTGVTTIGPMGAVTYTGSSRLGVFAGGRPYTTQPTTVPSGVNANGVPEASMPQMLPGYVSGPLTTAPAANANAAPPPPA
jgi:hypothetical protein